MSIEEKAIYVESKDGSLSSNFFPFTMEKEDIICARHRRKILFLVDRFDCPECIYEESRMTRFSFD